MANALTDGLRLSIWRRWASTSSTGDRDRARTREAISTSESADDFVVSFQFRKDADQFQQRVRERFAEFGLELAEEKTRRIFFGRFADVTCLRHGLGRPETFEFLGFKHVCGVDRAGRFALIRIPSVKSCRKF